MSRLASPARALSPVRTDCRASGPALFESFHRHVRATSQPQAEHHRDLLQLEQDADGFATQMVQTPRRQPVRQIAQRHNQDCAPGTKRPGAGLAREPTRVYGTARAPRAREMVSAAVRTAGPARSGFIRADQPETDSAPATWPPGPCTGLATQTRPGRDSSES
jgi:hypothetical protein